MITTDTNLRYQQNLQARSIAILVLSTTSWPRIKAAAAQVAEECVLMIAGQFNLQTVAEGVENEAQWKLLHDLGCDRFQGYWLAKPLKSLAMADLMRAELAHS